MSGGSFANAVSHLKKPRSLFAKPSCSNDVSLKTHDLRALVSPFKLARSWQMNLRGRA